MHVDDMANACMFLMEKYSGNESVNVGSGYDITIRELAEIIGEIVGFEGSITQDTSMPDGTPRKLLDSSKLFALGWRASIGLREGLARVYHDYVANQHTYRM